jgi:hypothetical protein
MERYEVDLKGYVRGSKVTERYVKMGYDSDGTLMELVDEEGKVWLTMECIRRIRGWKKIQGAFVWYSGNAGKFTSETSRKDKVKGSDGIAREYRLLERTAVLKVL